MTLTIRVANEQTANNNNPALLCFSVAANADAYFCETLRNMNLLADGFFNPNISRNDFVVDTEKRIRIGASENYLGSCSTIVVASIDEALYLGGYTLTLQWALILVLLLLQQQAMR